VAASRECLIAVLRFEASHACSFLLHHLRYSFSFVGGSPGGVGDRKQGFPLLHEASFFSRGGARENVEPSWKCRILPDGMVPSFILGSYFLFRVGHRCPRCTVIMRTRNGLELDIIEVYPHNKDLKWHAKPACAVQSAIEIRNVAGRSKFKAFLAWSKT